MVDQAPQTLAAHADGFPAAVEAAVRDAAGRHARWDATAFSALCDGPARELWSRLTGQPLAQEVLAGYLALLREAVAAGYVRRAVPEGEGRDAAAEWDSFLEYCLVRAVPRDLVRTPPPGRLELMAKVWNLGEALLREPAWVGRYVVSRAGEVARLDEIEAFLVRVLEPALEPAPPSEWRGPFAVTVLDLRPAADDFLPGPMYLGAPALLSVRDRRRPEACVNVLLRHEGKSQLLGPSPPLAAYDDGETVGAAVSPGSAPPVVFDRNRVMVGEHAVPLRFLARVHSHQVVRAGFIVAGAVDSQRIWIVESR